MSSYFPIPNNIYYGDDNQLKIKSSIKVFNYPNNAKKDSLFKKEYKKDIYFSLYFLSDFEWIKVYDKKCDYGEIKEFKREELDIPENSTAVIIPSKDKSNPQHTNFLPKPYSLRIDKSPINERASYNFELNNSISSYQGELPFELTSLKSDFFTSDLLRLDLDKNDKTFLFLMNISRKSNENSQHKLRIIDSEYNFIKEINIQSNTFDGFILPKRIKSNNQLFLTCKTSTFIPIFISTRIEKGKYEINVEHTHPPHEMFLGPDRYKLLKKLKHNWIEK